MKNGNITTCFEKIVKQEKVDMTFYVANVAKNNLYRDFEVRFFDEEQQSFVDISSCVADALQMKIKDWCVRVDGVGMNMAFKLSLLISEYVLKTYGKEIHIKEHIFTRSERDLYVNFIQSFLKEKLSN